MVFQKPYLNIVWKRSAQRAIPSWEHTKLSTKLIRVILRQPNESEEEENSPCPAQFCKMVTGAPKLQFAAQAYAMLPRENPAWH